MKTYKGIKHFSSPSITVSHIFFGGKCFPFLCFFLERKRVRVSWGQGQLEKERENES